MMDLMELADAEPEGLETLRVWKIAIEALSDLPKYAKEYSSLACLFDALDAEEQLREELSEPNQRWAVYTTKEVNMPFTYTAVVLDAGSQAKLKEVFAKDIPQGWEVIIHHMTTNLGPAAPQVQPHIGQTVDLVAKTLAGNELVLAAGVECPIWSMNQHKHVTLAVNRAAGGKPQMSNDLQEWVPVAPVQLRGTVMEVTVGGPSTKPEPGAGSGANVPGALHPGK
jgi:hypothetical protein